MIVSVCRISQKLHGLIFVHVNWTVVVAQSSSVYAAIGLRCILPVLWMTSCFRIMGSPYGASCKQREDSVIDETAASVPPKFCSTIKVLLRLRTEAKSVIYDCLVYFSGTLKISS